MNRLTLPGLLLLVMLGGWLLWRDDMGMPATPEAAATSQPRYHIEKLRAVRTDPQGTPLLRLTAEQAAYFDDGAASLTQIEAAGLSGEAAPWVLNAPSGTVTAGEKRLLLHAPVKGQGQWTSGENFDFAGSEVWVDDSQRQFYSSQPLTLVSPTRSAHAKGFSAGFDGKTLTMTQPELSYVLED